MDWILSWSTAWGPVKRFVSQEPLITGLWVLPWGLRSLMWTYNTALGEISSIVVKLCTNFMPSLQTEITTGIQQFILFSFHLCYLGQLTQPLCCSIFGQVTLLLHFFNLKSIHLTMQILQDWMPYMHSFCHNHILLYIFRFSHFVNIYN